MIDELKPCPFCGTEPKAAFQFNLKKRYRICATSGCAIEGVMMEDSAWNTRHESSRTPDYSWLDEQAIERALLTNGTVRVNDDGSAILCLSKDELLKSLLTMETRDTITMPTEANR